MTRSKYPPIVVDEEFINKNYDKTILLLNEHDHPKLKKLVETFAQEYATAPASTHASYYSAFTGGLCYHNLNVIKFLNKLCNTLSPDTFAKKTILTVSILQSFGRVGADINTPYFIPASSDWQHNQGKFFDINPDISFMKIPHRSLFLAQQYDVQLTEEEYLAVLLSDGHLDETNAHYKYKEPSLAQLLQMAVFWSRKVESRNNP